jgi:hypothetical protein
MDDVVDDAVDDELEDAPGHEESADRPPWAIRGGISRRPRSWRRDAERKRP